VRIAFDLRRAFLEPIQTPWIEAATAELTDENDYWFVLMLAIAFATASADAKGCIKGAVVGGASGLPITS